jgi:Uma2 family endonuclease
MNIQIKTSRKKTQTSRDPLSAELRRRLETEDPRYPHSDGKPLAESEPHLQCIRWLLDAIEDLFKGRENVAYHGDMFWYWQEGHPEKRRAPDVMVLFGVPMDPIRLSYKSWEHDGIVPAIVIETASAEQKTELFGDLFDDYESLGVREYFVFDWSKRYLDQQLYGYRLKGSRYQAIPPAADGSLLSKQLKVKLRTEGKLLRLVDAKTNEPMKTRSEQIAIARQELARRELALAAKEAEAARLRELLRKAGIDPDAVK